MPMIRKLLKNVLRNNRLHRTKQVQALNYGWTPVTRHLSAISGTDAVRNASTSDSSQKPRIVVIGSGWGGYCFLNSIDKTKFDVSVISPSNHFLFTPLLPSTVVGTLEFRAIQEPIRAVKGLKGFFHAKASSVDFKEQQVKCNSIFPHETAAFEVPYDYLVVACGSKTNTFNTPGIMARENEEVFFLKQLFHARQLRNRIVECFERAAVGYNQHHLEDSQRLLTFMVVGGGPTSVEFVGELQDLLRRDMRRLYPELSSATRIILVEAGPRLLPSFHPSLSTIVKSQFRSKGITVYTQVAVSAFDSKKKVVCLKNLRKDSSGNDGIASEVPDEIPVGAIIWSAGLQQVNFVKDSFSSYKKGHNARLAIDKKLRLIKADKPGESDGRTGSAFSYEVDERIFAIGDCAVCEETPLAPLAIVAKQQGHHLANQFNIGALTTTPITAPDFKFRSLFSMVTFGNFQGAIDFSSMEGKHGLGLKYMHGLASFFTWRSAYWGMQTSWANKMLIPMFWFKSFFFGRDVSRF